MRFGLLGLLVLTAAAQAAANGETVKYEAPEGNEAGLEVVLLAN